jgi:hypothetical protein
MDKAIDNAILQKRRYYLMSDSIKNEFLILEMNYNVLSGFIIEHQLDG